MLPSTWVPAAEPCCRKSDSCFRFSPRGSFHHFNCNIHTSPEQLLMMLLITFETQLIVSPVIHESSGKQCSPCSSVSLFQGRERGRSKPNRERKASGQLRNRNKKKEKRKKVWLGPRWVFLVASQSSLLQRSSSSYTEFFFFLLAFLHTNMKYGDEPCQERKEEKVSLCWEHTIEAFPFHGRGLFLMKGVARAT